MNPWGGNFVLVWFSFSFWFVSFCQSQKKKRGPSAERTAAAALTDLMTALATALVQAAGRGWERCQCWKMLPRQPWCKRQCWHRWLRVGKAAAWNAQEARKTGSGLGKGRGSGGESCVRKGTWCNNEAQERTRHPPKSRITDSSMQQFTHLGVPYTHSKPELHTGTANKTPEAMLRVKTIRTGTGFPGHRVKSLQK